MKNVEKVLFAYCLIAVTVIFISSAVYYPKPLSFITAITLLPMLAYFWIKMTSPEEVKASKWSIRLLAVIISITGLLIFGYFLTSTKQSEKETEELPTEEQLSSEKLDEIKSEIETLKGEDASSDELLDKIDSIQEELLKLRANSTGSDFDSETISDILSGLDNKYKTTDPVGYIEISKTILSPVDVLSDSDDTSTVVGKIEMKQIYPFFESAGSWYLIRLPDDTMGWVNSDSVEEIE